MNTMILYTRASTTRAKCNSTHLPIKSKQQGNVEGDLDSLSGFYGNFIIYLFDGNLVKHMLI